MIFLLNAIPAFVILITALALYKLKGWKNKITALIVCFSIITIYGQVQPSYLPKGTTKSLPNAEFVLENKPIEDRTLKPMSPEERFARMKKTEEETSQRIEILIKQAKSEKE